MQEKTYYQLKIKLNDFAPSIYRKIVVDSSTSFSKLHKHIQNAFGLDNYHLWQFSTGRRNFKGNGIKLSEILKEEKDKIKYTYDFGVDWKFTITLEKIISETEFLSTKKLKDKKVPFLLKAQGPMLIADCSGSWGLADVLNLYEELKSGKKLEKNDKFDDNNSVENILYNVIDPYASEDWKSDFMEEVEFLFEIDLENFEL